MTIFSGNIKILAGIMAVLKNLSTS